MSQRDSTPAFEANVRALLAASAENPSHDFEQNLLHAVLSEVGTVTSAAAQESASHSDHSLLTSRECPQPTNRPSAHVPTELADGISREVHPIEQPPSRRHVSRRLFAMFHESQSIREDWRARLTMRITIPVGVAAAVAGLIYACVIGYTQKSATAAEVLQQAVEATSAVKTMHVSARIRVLAYDGSFKQDGSDESVKAELDFENINIDADFASWELWKEFGSPARWCLHSGTRGLMARSDGKHIGVLSRGPSGGIRVYRLPDNWQIGLWLRSLLEPETLLQSELEAARQGGLNTQLTFQVYPPDPTPQRVLTVDTKPGTNSPEPGKPVKSLAASDNRRIYRFDAKGKRLLGLEVYAHTSHGDVLLLETTQIEYDQPVDSQKFQVP